MKKNIGQKFMAALALFVVLSFVTTDAFAAYNVKQAWTRFSATAGETLATGDVVMLKDADGKAYEADANDAALRPAIGIIGKGGASGATVEIITSGILTGWTSLTEGAPGYLSDTVSLITQTAPSYVQVIGKAITSTDYEIRVESSSPADPELAALAGLTSAANKIPYFTGSATAGVIASSANMVSFLGSADYATARTNLGLAIGTNVQAYDADLTTYAGIAPSANVQTLLGAADFAAVKTSLALTIGADVQAYDADLTTYAGITPSANVQTLLSAADFAAVRTSLALTIGTNVQAYDADLTTYAGIPPTASAQTALGNAADAVVLNHRHRATIAEINAGHSILPAIAGKSYRMIQCLAIAYGGAVVATTTVDLLGTQAAGSVKLVAYAVAGLAQSAVLVSGGTNAAVTADGASYTPCDANTAITVGKTGADLTTATGVDFVLTYVIE